MRCRAFAGLPAEGRFGPQAGMTLLEAAFCFGDFKYGNRFIDFAASRVKMFSKPEKKRVSRVKKRRGESGVFGKHPQKWIKGLARFLKTDEGLDLKEVKTGIGFGIEIYSKSFMDSFDEVVS